MKLDSFNTGHVRGLADLQKEQLGRALATAAMETLDIPDGFILESDQNPRAPASKFKMGIAQPLESRP